MTDSRLGMTYPEVYDTSMLKFRKRPPFMSEKRWKHLLSRKRWRAAATDRELDYLDPIGYDLRQFLRAERREAKK